MPSIGNIVVRRERLHKLLPPIGKPIVKPTYAVTIAPEIVSAPLSVMPPGGQGAGEGPQIKTVIRGITQTVLVSDSVNRIKVSGIVGISYTQTSYTFTSYTIGGNAIVRPLATEILTITEPLSVQRSKTRRISDSDATETSETVTIARTKARALATQTVSIDETLTNITPVFRELATETQTISDSVVAVKGSTRLRIENVALDDHVNMETPGAKMSLIEDISILEDLDFEVTHPGGVNITKSLSDTVNIAIESVTRKYALSRALAQSLSISESLVKQVTTGITSFTTVSFTDTSYLILTATRAEKALSEVTEESHTVRLVLTKNRGLSESVTIIG